MFGIGSGKPSTDPGFDPDFVDPATASRVKSQTQKAQILTQASGSFNYGGKNPGDPKVDPAMTSISLTQL